MIKKTFEMVFGTASERTLKRYRPMLERISALDEKIKAMADADFPKRTAELKALVAERFETIHVPLNDDDVREKRKEAEIEILNEFLPEAFAMCREAGRRSIGLRHFDVQLLGGMVLHNGSIAEMRTGEGKTLVATAPAYLNALVGKGVHIVTVNDYLAKRDSEWMGPVFKFLGLTVGVVQHDVSNIERQAGYLCDITYVTNNEIGFDYLRDNMVVRKEAPRPAPALLRDHRRGRLDPRRRGAHAADHLRRGREVDRALRYCQSFDPSSQGSPHHRGRGDSG